MPPLLAKLKSGAVACRHCSSNQKVELWHAAIARQTKKWSCGTPPLLAKPKSGAVARRHVPCETGCVQCFSTQLSTDFDLCGQLQDTESSFNGKKLPADVFSGHKEEQNLRFDVLVGMHTSIAITPNPKGRSSKKGQ